MSRDIFLSACLIVRDAAEDLAWCLEGLAGEVDEIVVVDTGSQDATKTIARRFTKQVHSFAWNDDFSAARNFALSKVRGRWVFCPDSDERLMGERGALRRAVKGAEGLGEKALSLLRHEMDEQGRRLLLPDNPAVRLLRRGGGLAYHDPVHEYLAYPDGTAPAAPLVPPDELSLAHRGYAPARKAAKAARNLRILEHAEETGQRKLYLHYYLAGLYLDTKQYEAAAREAELSITAGEHPAHGALEVWRGYATALEKLGRKERLEELCKRGIEAVPELPDFYARLGVMAMNQQAFEEGERYLSEALSREEAFAAACPTEYDTFRAAVPQVEKLLRECRMWTKEGQMGTTRKAPEKEQPSSAQAEAAAAVEKAAQALADIVPTASKRVVIFGCGTGAAGALLLRRNPAMQVYGFTPERADAVAAGRVMTGAFVGTPATTDLADYGLSDVDCIAYAPAVCAELTPACLARHAAALAADGQMACLMPNPGYLGRMAAANAGVQQQACPSPVKVSVALRQAGMASVYLLPQIRPEDEPQRQDPAARALVQQLSDYAKAHGIAQGNNDPLAESYVLHAARQKTPSVSVQTMIGEATVTARVRVWEPDSFCAAETGWFPRSSTKRSYNRSFAEQMNGSIIVQQRMSFATTEMALEACARLRGEGHVIVYEIDDNPMLWKDKLEESRYMDFRGVHAVQVSTPALAAYARQYNPHVFVFENHLKELPAPRDYTAEAAARDGRVTIFFGAVNREAEWREIVPALNAAVEKYGDKLQFLVLADQPSFDLLKTPHKRFVGDLALYGGRYVSYETYRQALYAADISLLPLRDNAFNRMKSDLKFIESAANGAVALASPTVYERTLVDGCTGCIYRSPEEFSAKLARLIEDAPYRQAIARAGYGYVKEHRLISQHYRERMAAYRWMVAHRAELDLDLEARLQDVRREIGASGGMSHV